LDSIKALQAGKGIKFTGPAPSDAPGMALMIAADFLNLDARFITGYLGQGPNLLALQNGEADFIGSPLDSAVRVGAPGAS